MKDGRTDGGTENPLSHLKVSDVESSLILKLSRYEHDNMVLPSPPFGEQYELKNEEGDDRQSAIPLYKETSDDI